MLAASAPFAAEGTELSPTGQAALAHAREGRYVFPVCWPTPDGACGCPRHHDDHSVGKAPLTARGHLDATLDEATIRAWWQRWPEANVAVNLERSGLVLLDQDSREAAQEAQQRSGPAGLPPGPIVRSGRGEGWHRYYTRPEDWPVTSSTHFGTSRAIDIKTNGYAILPPSVHRSGRQYKYETDFAQPLSPPPAWMRDALVQSHERRRVLPLTIESASASSAVEPPVRLQGAALRRWHGEIPDLRHDGTVDRSQTLFFIGCDLAEAGASQNTVAAAVRERDHTLGLLKYAERSDAAARYAEIAAKAVDYATSERLPTAVYLDHAPRPAEPAHPTARAGSVSPVWVPPVPFVEHDLPPFPLETLPNALRAFARELSVATQTPPDLAGMTVLAVLAAVCGGVVEIEPRRGWVEPLNLYLLTILPSGNRKSSVLAAATAPLADWERMMANAWAPRLAVAENARKILEQRLHQARTEATRAKAGDGAEAEQEAQRLARELVETKVRGVPRLLVDDCTPEKLAQLLSEQNGRIAALSAEGDLFELIAGRYAANKAPNLGVYLKGHSGEQLRVDRIGRPSELVEHPALTIGIAAQPDVLAGLASKPGFLGRGLLGRILYALPESRLGRRDTNPKPVDDLTREVYEERIRALLALQEPADEPREPVGSAPVVLFQEFAQGRPRLHLNDEATERLDQLMAEVEPQLGPDGDFEHMADWGGKFVGAVVRVAGLLHLAAHACERTPWEIPLSVDTLERAIELGRYLAAHARAAYGLMGADPAVDDARFVLRAIQRLQTTETPEGQLLSHQEIWQATRSRFKKAEGLDTALGLLVDRGYLREVPKEGGSKAGRPPKPNYVRNPLVVGLSSANQPPVVGGFRSCREPTAA